MNELHVKGNWCLYYTFSMFVGQPVVPVLFLMHSTNKSETIL